MDSSNSNQDNLLLSNGSVSNNNNSLKSSSSSSSSSSSKPIIPSISSLDISSTSTNSDSSTFTSGIFNGFKNISSSSVLFILLVFLLLGFNVFLYFSKGTEEIFKYTTPLLDGLTELFLEIYSGIAYVIGEISKFFITLFASTSTKAINKGSTEVNKSITSVQKIGKEPPQDSDANSTIKYDYVSDNKSNKNSSKNKKQSNQEKTITKALNTASSNMNNNKNNYSEDESSSTIQNGNKQGGWCYIGSENGVRTCAKVKYSSNCMSGNIFPSNEICINPNLRE